MDNGTKILKEILERVKNLSKEEYLQLYQEAMSLEPVEIILDFENIDLKLCSNYQYHINDKRIQARPDDLFNQYNCISYNIEAKPFNYTNDINISKAA